MSKDKSFIMLYELTYPEVAASKLPVCCIQGYLWAGPDRRGTNAPHPGELFHAWKQDVKTMMQSTAGYKLVPQPVADMYIRLKDLSAPPKEEVVPALPASAKPLFPVSYTSISQFLTCPLQWAAAKKYKELPFVETEATRWGNRVHAACEAVLQRRATEEDLKLTEEVGATRFLEPFLAAGAEAEVELCLTKDLEVCGWKDFDVCWFRSKADVLIRTNEALKIYDWKTGSRFDKNHRDKADLFQLEVMFAVAAEIFPDAQTFDGRLIYLKEVPERQLAKLETPLTRAEIPEIWKKIRSYTDRMEAAWDSENFRAQPSGLCRNYCGYTKCPHCGK